MKVLLADDDQDQLLLRGMLLRRSGFEALEANDFQSAVQLARAQKPECAIVDLRLPTQERGFQLVRELKALDPSIHIVVLTGTNPAGWSFRCEKDLVEEIVMKGSSSVHLIEKLKAIATAGHV